MTDYIFFGIGQLADETSLSTLFIVNGALIVLIVILGFVALRLLFRHVDDQEAEENK